MPDKLVLPDPPKLPVLPPHPDDLPRLVLEPLDFVCPTCGAAGGVRCVDEDGEPIASHHGRAPVGR